MAPLSDWLVTAVNHRLKQYKHPLLLALVLLVLLAVNTAFFVSMTFYLAGGPEMARNFGEGRIWSPVPMQDPVFQQEFEDISGKVSFTLTECAVLTSGTERTSRTCCTGTHCPATDDGPEIFYTAIVSMCNPCISDDQLCTLPGCHYTYKDVSWADAIGIAGGYVALVDSIFTMMIIIIYLTCTGQPPAAVVSSPPLSRQLITLVCPRVNVHYRVAVTA